MDKNKWEKIIRKIKVIQYGEEEKLINSLSENKDIQVVGFVNAHAMNLISISSSFYNNLISCDILLRDGSGMKLLYKALGEDPGLNMNGTDFIPKLLKKNRSKRIALLGTQEPYLSKASDFLKEKNNLNIVFQYDGFRETEFYIDKLKSLDPDIIVLGMGMPKQELVAAELKKSLKSSSVIVCGGAIIDFLAGRYERAPVWMRKMGFEWVYRLIKEPKRLFRRYIYGNPIFLFNLIRIKCFK